MPNPDIKNLVQIAQALTGGQAASLYRAVGDESSSVATIEEATGPVAGKVVGLDVDNGVGASLAHGGNPIVVNNPHACCDFNRQVDIATGFRTESLIAVPIMIDGAPYGAIQVINRSDGRQFTEHDLETLEKVARLIATSLRCEELQKDAALTQLYLSPLTLYERQAHGLVSGPSLGRSVTGTALSSDLSSSSDLIREIGERNLLPVLQRLYDLHNGIITRHGGLIANNMGDGTLAVFLEEVAGPGHIIKALRAAMEIQKWAGTELHVQGISVESRHKLRIGLDSGNFELAQLGKDFRQVTPIGDCINQASHLQEMAELGGIRLAPRILAQLHDLADVSDLRDYLNP